MSTAGPTIAGTGADVTGVGTFAWLNPGNITANDGSSAVASICFPAGTLVTMADGTTKVIETIAVNDVVVSYSDVGVTQDVVLSLFSNSADTLYQIETATLSVKATADHPFYTPNQDMVSASELAIGDNIMVLDGDHLIPDTITNISMVSGTVAVYNIEVDRNHTYIASGFAVHNVSCSIAATDNIVRLIQGGTISGNNNSVGAANPSAFTLCNYGSSADLWGLSWAYSDINASNFGVAYSATSSNTSHYLEATNFGFSIPSGATINGIQVGIYKAGTGAVSVDYIQITVTYTLGGVVYSTSQSSYHMVI